jgi:hypothetical protein
MFIFAQHQALAIRNRGYTNKVRLRGLTENQGFQTRAGGFCLCSLDFQSPGARCEIWVDMLIFRFFCNILN